MRQQSPFSTLNPLHSALITHTRQLKLAVSRQWQVGFACGNKHGVILDSHLASMRWLVTQHC